MPENINMAFEGSELNMVENGHQTKKSYKDKDVNCVGESSGCFISQRNALNAFARNNRRAFKVFGLILLNLLVFVYLAWASIHWKSHSTNCEFEWCNGYGMFLIIVTFTYAGIFYYWILKPYFGKSIVRCCQPLTRITGPLRGRRRCALVGKTAIYLLILMGFIIFLIYDTAESRDRLISASGVVILLVLGLIISKHPSQINWRPVFCGLILQFALGLISIRWTVGREIFQCVSRKIATFLDFAKHGSRFIFSDLLVDNNVFAFTVLPVIFYFSFIIQILYYLGVMQWVLLKLGWALQKLMGTTLCESVNCAANTFVGMSESPLIIKPYINKLTSSELHAIMLSGFATVSGTVLAAYIGFGAQPAHLLTASIMAAPAALCYAKLIYPETEQSRTSCDNIELEKSTDSGVLDAATKGALAAIPLVLGIIANIVAFVSFIALINGLLGWFGGLVGYTDLTFELILSKLFMPLSWLMGVPWKDCEDVGTLIGLKTVVNEFIAYQKLGEFKRQGRIYGRTEAIATFAICGFSNPGSIGIMIGTLTSLAPEKRKEITGGVMRAFVGGCAVCFLTASTAGMLMDGDLPSTVNMNSTTVAL
ncbi:hypothetical protein KM043_011428 [Ampulex compressa]|nr:hypothetical protein KM043_011428 [Ampulex compressa]